MSLSLTLASLGAELGSVNAELSWTQQDAFAAARKGALLTEIDFCLRRFVLPDGRTWDAEQTVQQLGLSDGDVIQVVNEDLLVGTWIGTNFPGTRSCIGRFCEVRLELAASGTFDLCLSGIFHDWENEFNKHDRGIFSGAWIPGSHAARDGSRYIILQNVQRGGDGLLSLNEEGINARLDGRSKLLFREICMEDLLRSLTDEKIEKVGAQVDEQNIVVPVHSSSPLQLCFRHTAGWANELILTRDEDLAA